jgi:integrase
MLCKVKGSRNFYTKFSIGRKRVRKSTGTEDRKLAEEYEQHLREKLWKAYRLGFVRHTWEEAVVIFCLGKDVSKFKWHLTMLDKYCRGKYLDELSGVRDELVKDRLSTGIKTFRRNGVSNLTVNKTLSYLRAILLNVKRKGWVDSVSVEMLPEPPGRVRWITHDDAERLIHALPLHLKDMVRFSLATGLRETNVTRLEWSSVDLERRIAWVKAEDFKNREPHQIPLNSEAILVLRRQLGKHNRWVFSLNGREVQRINNHGWRNSLKRAGIENFRVHDLRHTWASWHIQAGTPIPVLQKLGGWKTLHMVMRYSHLATSHLAEHADNICRPRLVSGIDNISSVAK